MPVCLNYLVRIHYGPVLIWMNFKVSLEVWRSWTDGRWKTAHPTKILNYSFKGVWNGWMRVRMILMIIHYLFCWFVPEDISSSFLTTPSNLSRLTPVISSTGYSFLFLSHATTLAIIFQLIELRFYVGNNAKNMDWVKNLHQIDLGLKAGPWVWNSLVRRIGSFR